MRSPDGSCLSVKARDLWFFVSRPVNQISHLFSPRQTGKDIIVKVTVAVAKCTFLAISPKRVEGDSMVSESFVGNPCYLQVTHRTNCKFSFVTHSCFANDTLEVAIFDVNGFDFSNFVRYL